MYIFVIVISGSIAFRRAAFGQGTGPILLDDLECVGTEQTLLDCRLDVRTADCRHRKDAGVRCQARGMRHSSVPILTHSHLHTYSLICLLTHTPTRSFSISLSTQFALKLMSDWSMVSLLMRVVLRCA